MRYRDGGPDPKPPPTLACQVHIPPELQRRGHAVPPRGLVGLPAALPHHPRAARPPTRHTLHAGACLCVGGGMLLIPTSLLPCGCLV